MSSFQLHDTPSLKPTVGVLTNLSPDHLDRYPTRRGVLRRQGAALRERDDRLAMGAQRDDDSRAPRWRAKSRRQVRFLDSRREADAWFDSTRRVARSLLGEPLIAARRSRHCSAITTSRTLLPRRSRSRLPTIGFQRPRKRATRIAEASSLQRARASARDRRRIRTACSGSTTRRRRTSARRSSRLKGMQRPTVLLLGGRHKGEPYTALADAISEAVKHVIAYGEAAPIVEKDLDGVVPLERLGSDFEEVMRRARELRAAGRRRSAVARVLELRHVQELRGARRAIPSSSRWRNRWPTQSADVRYRWHMGAEARARSS